jgi:hypothetical protein
MAGFGRSNSLSINTGGGGLLYVPMSSRLPVRAIVLTTGSGNTAAQNTTASQPQSSGGLFGGAQQPASASLFGGAQPQASQPQSGGLFGGAAGGSKLTTPGTTGGGLFGASTAQAQPQGTAQSGGLFGGAGQSKPSLL